MTSRLSRRLAIALSAALLLARVFPAPSFSDPTGASLPAGVHLHVPPLYLFLAPLFSLWDGISMLSMSRLRGFLLGLGLLYLAWRLGASLRRRERRKPIRVITGEAAALAGSAAGLMLFLAAGALWHRPMVSLAGEPEDLMAVDFHSHTNVSHDVRNTLMNGFDAEANARWHRRAGFDAVFITDHNTTSGWRGRDPVPENGTPLLCPGIEVSGYAAHVVLLGDTLPIDQHHYDGSLEALLGLFADAHQRYGSLSIASIPEYEEHHWHELERFLTAGLDGFEVVNAAPKANEMTRAHRDTVIALARAHGRLIVGASDIHGWGATNMVWNLVAAPGWRAQRQTACETLLSRLREGAAIHILERNRLRPDDWWPNWLTPAGVLWETWRGMGWPLTLAWLAWIWGLAFSPNRK